MLDVSGNAFSYLGLMPRNQSDHEGQLIADQSEVLIRVHERSGEFIHTSSKHNVPFRFNSFRKATLPSTLSPSSNLRDAKRSMQSSATDVHEEVNSSLDSTLWSISVFNRPNPYVGKVLSNSKTIVPVLAGQLVTLQYPESLSCLAVEPLPANSKAKDTARRKVVMSPQFHVVDIHGMFQGDLEVSIGSHLLWLVERSAGSYTRGGPITLESDVVILRNLNTGLYLHRDIDDQVFAVAERDLASELTLHCVSVNHERYVLEDSAVYIAAADGRWMGRPTTGAEVVPEQKNDSSSTDSDEDDDDDDDDIQSNNSRVEKIGGGSKLFSIQCEWKMKKSEAMSFLISPNLSSRVGVSSLYVGRDATMILSYFCNLITAIKGGNSFVLRESKNCIPFICTVLEHLYHYMYFDQGEQKEADVFLHDLDSNFIGPNDLRTFKIRQTMMSEQGILNVLLNLLELTNSNVFNKLGSSHFTRSASVLDFSNRVSTSGKLRSRSSLTARKKSSLHAEMAAISDSKKSVDNTRQRSGSSRMIGMFSNLIRHRDSTAYAIYY